MYRTFHPKGAKYTCNIFKYGSHGKTKTSLNKFKKIEIVSIILSNHKGLKLETNLKEKTQKQSNSWILNSMLLNNEWVKNEIQEESKKLVERNKNEHTTVQNLWDTSKTPLRGKFIAI